MGGDLTCLGCKEPGPYCSGSALAGSVREGGAAKLSFYLVYLLTLKSTLSGPMAKGSGA